jgi:hypothetical protein
MNTDLRFNIDKLNELSLTVQNHRYFSNSDKPSISEYTKTLIEKITNGETKINNKIYNKFFSTYFDLYIHEHRETEFYNFCFNNMIELKCKFNNQLTNYILSLISSTKYESLEIAFSELFNDELLEKLFDLNNEQKCKFLIFFASLRQLISKFKQFVFDNFKLCDFIQCLFDHKNVCGYKLLVKNNKIIPTIEHLKQACSKRLYSLVQIIIDHKVIPDHECLEVCLREIYKYDSNSVKILNLLLVFDVELNENNLIKIIEKHIDIENFTLYELVTSKIFKVCVKNKFFPKFMEHYKLTDDDIYYLFSQNYIEEIPIHIQNMITKYDLRCLELACNMPDNLSTIRFILRKNIDADYKTICKVINKRYKINSLKKLIDKYNI